MRLCTSLFRCELTMRTCDTYPAAVADCSNTGTGLEVPFGMIDEGEIFENGLDSDDFCVSLLRLEAT